MLGSLLHRMLVRLERSRHASTLRGVVDRWATHFAEASVSARDIAQHAAQIDRPFLLAQRKLS
jgi:hypothetical protein